MNSRDRIGGPLLVREKNLDAGEKGYDTLLPHISLMHDLLYLIRHPTGKLCFLFVYLLARLFFWRVLLQENRFWKAKLIYIFKQLLTHEFTWVYNGGLCQLCFRTFPNFQHVTSYWRRLVTTLSRRYRGLLGKKC